MFDIWSPLTNQFGISPAIAKETLLLTPCLLLSRFCYNPLPLTLPPQKKKTSITMLCYIPTFLEIVQWGRGNGASLLLFEVYMNLLWQTSSFTEWAFLHLTQNFKFVTHTRGKGWLGELSKFRYHTSNFSCPLANQHVPRIEGVEQGGKKCVLIWKILYKTWKWDCSVEYLQPLNYEELFTFSRQPIL